MEPQKRKPTDHRLAPQTKSQLADAELFTKLQDAEKRLDSLVTRKRLDLQDVIGRSMRRSRTLRIYISSSVHSQSWQSQMHTDSFDFSDPDTTPEWTLRIEGRLVDEDQEPRRMFSSMFTSIIVELERQESEDDMMPDAPPKSEVVEWHEVPPHSTEPRVDFDGLDIRRRGDQPVKAKITMQLKEYPDKFKLSKQLQDVLGLAEESKPGVVVALWQYIRFHKLQDPDEKRLIKCDAPLRALFGRDQVTFPQLVEHMQPHLSPRDPVVFEYVVECDKDLENRDVAYDVPIKIDDTLRQRIIHMLDSWHQDKTTLWQLDLEVLNDVQKLNSLAYQQDFYRKLAEDPCTFFSNWVASQARDLKTIDSDRQISEESVRHSSFYSEEVLNQSIHLFLNNK